MSSQTYSSDTFKPLLAKLVKHPTTFTPDDTKSAFEHLLKPDSITPAQIGAFLTALHISGVDQLPGTLAAAAGVLKEHCIRPKVEGYDDGDFVVDIVGTGGDGHDTFNVSTAAAIIAAGAGARVCKHGNRASTSSSGSADLLMALQCSLQPFPTLPRSSPFVFLLAPHYHPSLAPLAPIRKTLPFRTIMNILGPLVNPSFPHGMVVGVPSRHLGPVFAKALHEGGVKRALVVCGQEGLDEISCAGPSWTWKVSEETGEVLEGIIDPSDFGLPGYPLEVVKGGPPAANAVILEKMLTAGAAGIPQELQPILDFILLNASAVLVVAGLAKDYKEGVSLAKQSVENGKAWEALMKFRELGKQFEVAKVLDSAGFS
ncbi:anthranilate phosphoribosyltransferase [Sistotremastrum suecicum HHB10207 ss-3]|uniref:Anthranilate phosphoribosyltransferase n=1 Tax=Sistotremastrum suecicum HHB10207 ss-3 TaxID=1314776 RepID=A0A166AE25_9AGAM|nr:anthranilate phosphoribosyltransferase [Sistotremastrum suecicum HHB10207 ss-3]